MEIWTFTHFAICPVFDNDKPDKRDISLGLPIQHPIICGLGIFLLIASFPVWKSDVYTYSSAE